MNLESNFTSIYSTSISTLLKLPLMNSTPTAESIPFSPAGITASKIIILSLLVIGVLANTLTIIVIATYKELYQSLFMRFILSLCVSDLISCLISWLFLYRRTWGFEHWGLPNFLCKVYWGVDMTTSFVTALHILSFSIYRYLSIKYNSFYKKITLFHGYIWMGAIWLVCICSAAVPCFFIFGASDKNRTSDTPISRWPACTAKPERLEDYLLFQKLTYTIFFYLPTIGVIVICMAILFVVCHKSQQMSSNFKSKKRKQQERKAVVQLLLIIFSFLIGYIPFTTYEFWSVEDHPNKFYYRQVDFWFGMAGYILLRFSECLNPLFYNIGSPLVRKHSKMFVQTKLCCFKAKQAEAPKEKQVYTSPSPAHSTSRVLV